jgi:hypothetical protein
MNTIGRAFFAAASIALFSAALPQAARANISLGVQPLVAEFNVQPGSSGHIAVTISNNGTDPERVIARRTDWRTIADGSIALEKPGAERGHSITRDLSLSTYQFTLEPGENRTVTLALAMPDSTGLRSGSYWGGFIINATDVNAPPSALGVAATVFIYNNVGSPARRLRIQSMRLTGNGGDAKLIARFRNTGLGYVRPVAHLLIGEGGRIVRDQKITISTVFPGATRIMSQPIGHLPAGDYRVEMTIDYGGNSILDAVTNARIH